MVDSAEQRNFPRMTISGKVTVHVLEEDVIFTASARNLSASGLSFNCAKQLHKGDELEISIAPGKEGATLPLHAVVEVVRVDEIVPGREYAMGCLIKEMEK